MPNLTDPLLVITDLDGSLFDHNTYSWHFAAEWLERLKVHDIPVVICSSKTAKEIIDLKNRIGVMDAPFIAENGASLHVNAHWQSPALSIGNFIIKDYASLRAVMERLRDEQGYKFFGFGDVSAKEVAQWTGLTLKDAHLAKTRKASEAFIWHDSDERLITFTAALAREDLALTEGGRFYHVIPQGSGKGASVRWLLEWYKQYDGRAWQTLGLGDGPNDISMLEAVDYAVVIRGYSKTPVTLSSAYRFVYYTRAYGSEGWCEGLDHFITRRV